MGSLSQLFLFPASLTTGRSSCRLRLGSCPAADFSVLDPDPLLGEQPSRLSLRIGAARKDASVAFILDEASELAPRGAPVMSEPEFTDEPSNLLTDFVRTSSTFLSAEEGKVGWPGTERPSALVRDEPACAVEFRAQHRSQLRVGQMGEVVRLRERDDCFHCEGFAPQWAATVVDPKLFYCGRYDRAECIDVLIPMVSGDLKCFVCSLL